MNRPGPHSAVSFRVLYASVLLVLVAAATAVALSIGRERARAIEDGVRNAHNLAVVLGGQIARSVQAADIVLRNARRELAELEEWETADGVVPGREEEIHRRLARRLAMFPLAYQIVVTNRHGKAIAISGAWPSANVNLADRDYFKELATAGDDRLSISLPLGSRFSGERIIVLARRRTGPGGDFRGAISISIKRTYFESIYGSLNSIPDQRFTLVRRDGTVLIQYPGKPYAVGRKLPPESLFHQVVAQGGGHYRTAGVFGDVIRWVGVNPLHEYPLVVNVSIPEDALLKDWRARAEVTIAGTVALLACALTLLWIMGRQYNRLSESRHSLAEKTAALESEHSLLLEYEAKLDVALDNMSHGLVVLDGSWRISVCNGRFRDMLQLPAELAKPGCALKDIVAHCQRCRGYPPDLDEFMAGLVARVQGRGPFSYEFEDVDGRVILVRNDPLPGRGYVATLEDITERRRSEATILSLARSDALTGIANRSSFLEQVDDARRRMETGREGFNILLLDLDEFKRINDSLGHAAGDALLKRVARRLESTLDAADTLARLGGDEFAILQRHRPAPGPMPAAGECGRARAVALAGKILDTIGQPFAIDHHKVVVGTSIGIALAPADGFDPIDLMKKADLALYQAKSKGRSRYAFFEPEMAVRAEERNRLEEDLRTGLVRNEFTVHYQPIFEVASGRPRCVEALVRWDHPQLGQLAPDRFIGLAEDTGLINPLGMRVLETACADAVKWPSTVMVAVNISPVQFRKADLFLAIAATLGRVGLPPERLEIEITERVLLENDPTYLSTLHRLKKLGVSIALDDFGTGYSSLGYLKMFPFDKVKIDRSFTSELLERPECAAIVCAVASLGRSLDIITVAEGVENERQLHALRAAGVGQAQGYLLGRPAPAADIAMRAAWQRHGSGDAVKEDDVARPAGTAATSAVHRSF